MAGKQLSPPPSRVADYFAVISILPEAKTTQMSSRSESVYDTEADTHSEPQSRRERRASVRFSGKPTIESRFPVENHVDVEFPEQLIAFCYPSGVPSIGQRAELNPVEKEPQVISSIFFLIKKRQEKDKTELESKFFFLKNLY